MTTRLQSWQVRNGSLHPISTTLATEGRSEAHDLEKWLASEPRILGPDLLIIGRQLPTASGPLDLLAIDGEGNAVIVELKRDLLPRDALTQAIDYASDVATWSLDRLSEVCAKHTGASLDDALANAFPDVDLESLNINESQRILLVGFAIESSLERMIGWLSDGYAVAINAVVLNYIKTAGGEEVITRTTVISEEVERERGKRKKFHIPMSDTPGDHDESELKELLGSYLSANLHSARRIRDILLPACLEMGRVTREQLVQEFVRHEEAADPTTAGRFVSLISSQLGMEKNAFLRQVIGYEYPKYAWAKDNYHIREGYADLVRGVLAAIRG